MSVVAGVKVALRAQGWTVTKAMEKVRDADNEMHDVLAWRALACSDLEHHNQTAGDIR